MTAAGHDAGHDAGHAAATGQSWAVRSVRWYQQAAAGRPSPCRFTPTCSTYAVEALEHHGTVRGLILTLRRLLRCRPFGPSGWDPVPLPGESPSRRRLLRKDHP
ncbi:MAG: membrane protein insertion efficiency factor YidD [Ilumatobacteraceae bacterium]